MIFGHLALRVNYVRASLGIPLVSIALGGTCFPLKATGGAFAVISKAMSSLWAMRGDRYLLIRGLDSSAVWQPSVLLAGYVSGFFLVAVWLIHMREG